MESVSVHVGPKYQIVIPRQVREALGLHPDDALIFLLQGDTVILRSRPASFTAALRGLHKELWTDPEGWPEEERSSWE